MRISKVPTDMSSEQKEILGVLSKRHAVYLAVGGLLLYSYIPGMFKLLSVVFGWLAAAVTCLIFASPVVAIVIFLGFTKKEHMNRDFYYYIKFQRKTQYGNWRKGD
ncbi:PrgI family protein [Cytobacillus purgationiresistens]|uniref:PrgI family protein n=1 Tax=Cytobacillus purgationiresistens TaxID=863449 RepID=A0ABU0AR28_9BACI|nr:PrgI family protein [Cytobacillus purgationiresistens]MDQ0273495.1 hypothetical protein [Cytobacillus purgationiresistens]